MMLYTPHRTPQKIQKKGVTMKQIVNGTLYDTEKAQLVACSEWQYGRRIMLYKSAKGNFFAAYLTQWEGERDVIEPINIAEAKAFYERLTPQMNFVEAFGEAPAEA
jgi:hypothetical protein